jgi:hypothetical protein
MIIDGHEISDDLLKAEPPKRDYRATLLERLKWCRFYIDKARKIRDERGVDINTALPVPVLSQLIEYHESLKMASYYATTAEHFLYLWRKYNLGHDIAIVVDHAEAAMRQMGEPECG